MPETDWIALAELADKLDAHAKKALEPSMTAHSWPLPVSASPGTVQLAYAIQEIAACCRAIAGETNHNPAGGGETR